MAQVVKLKRTSVQGRIPSISNLELGELAINTHDGRIFFEKDDGTLSIQEILTTNSQNSGSFNLTGAISASSLSISGDTNIGGNLILGGNITIGDATTDVINVTAGFSGSLLPKTNLKDNLGSPTEKWKDLYVGTASADYFVGDGSGLTNLSISGLSTDYGDLENIPAGIVSSSAQISNYNTFLEINGDSVVSGSSQVILGDVTGFNTFSSSVSATFDGLSSNYEDLVGIPGDIVSGSSQVSYPDLSNIPSGIISGSSQITITESQISDLVHYTDSDVKTKLNSEGVVSGSSQVDYNSIQNTPTTISTQQASDITANNAKVGYTDTLVKTKLDTEGVISGSSQLTITQSQISDVNVTATELNYVDGVTSNIQTQLDAKQDAGSFVTTDSAQALSSAGDALTFAANTLTLTRGDGSTDTVNLSAYLDDTNLARVISGTYDSGSQELVFTRDDASTFTIDASMFFDDTNLVTSVNAGTAISVNSTTGVVTVTNTAPNVTTNLSTTANATSLTINSSDGTNASIPAATTSAWGAMTDEDKTKLDGIAAGANLITNNNQLTNGAGYIDSFDITTQTDSKYLRSDTSDTMNGSLNVTGNVGIGTSSPSVKLQVNGIGEFAGALRITEVGTAQNILIGNQDSGGTDKPSIIMGVNGALRFGWGSTWSGEGGTFTETLQLKSDGNAYFTSNVGIGQSTMIGTSAGRASLTIGGSLSGTINFGNAGTRWGGFYADSGDYAIYSDSLMRFETAGSERMRITSGGTVQIGATTGYTTINQGAFFTKGGGDMYTANLLAGAAVSPMFKLQRNDVEKYNIGLDGNDNLAFINASGVATISTTSSGNLGIGTISPASKLEINGDTSLRADYKLYFGQSNTSLGTWTTRMYANASEHRFNANSFVFNNEGYGSTEYMRIDSAGTIQTNVTKPYGSDTANLRLKLTPTGTNYSSGAFLNIVFGDETLTNSYLGDIQVVQENASVSTSSSMRFLTNTGGGNSATVERMRIDSSGNIGIGTSSPTAKLELYGSGSTVLDIQGSQGQLFSVTDDLTGTLFAVSDISGIPILEVDATGTVTVDGTLYSTGDVVAYSSSDKRLKDNIVPITNAVEKVSKLGGYEFDWNDKQDVYTGHDIGVLAQEVEEVLPELVSTRNNGYKAVNYEKLVALLIESNKELASRIEELEKKIQ